MKQTTLIILGWLMLGFTAHAASFDCGKAQTKVEKLICVDAELSKLDEELNAAYKTALQDEKQTDSIRQAQMRWMKERNECVDAECVRRAYEARLPLLKPAISAPLALPVNANITAQTTGATTTTQIACNNEDLHDGSNIRVQDIEGLYRQSIEGLPAIIGRPEEKLSGYNYLAIAPITGNKIRVRLSTKEINGHDCGFDSDALLCGRTIRLVPNKWESEKLRQLNLPAPFLDITQGQISFASIEHIEFYGWQQLYCGNRGSLNHIFKRSTRNTKIDDSVFNQ